MATIDQAKLQDIISKIKALPAPKPRSFVRRPPISKHRLAAAKMLEATLVKAGLDVAEFNKLLAEDRLEARKFLKKELAVSPSDAAAAKVAYQQRIEENLKIAKLLQSDFKPENTVQITEPFYISQSPTSPILQSGAIEPGGSYIKILVDTNSSGDTSGIFTFWYLWENDGPLDVAISAVSNLSINGAYTIEANPGELWGLFGSDTTSITIMDSLFTYRYSGWGTDPTTGQSNDNTLYPAPGGGGQVFAASVPNNGSYYEKGLFENLFSQLAQGLIFVPAGAVTLFKVNFELFAGFSVNGDQSGGGNIADLLKIDLNSTGYGVYCPSLWVSTWFRVPPFFLSV